jgi:hypothetical protein
MKRRTLIRLLVGLGIGIPLLIEGATFVGLIEAQFFGNGDGDPTTPTGTPPAEGIAVDDELLPETAAEDTLSTASLAAGADGRTLTLTVLVENTGDAPYELRLGAVRTRGGTRVGGSATTGTIAPGDSGTVTEQWDLPDGSMPGFVTVTAVVGDERVERTVPLATIPVGE